MNNYQYTRSELIKICEDAVVLEKNWGNRDSHEAQKQVGEALALLKAGCEFKTLYGGDLCTSYRTIWIEIAAEGFGFYEGFDHTCNESDRYTYKQKEAYYLPTVERLNRFKGKDWY